MTPTTLLVLAAAGMPLLTDKRTLEGSTTVMSTSAPATFDFSTRTVLVTGGGTGIGLATARAFVAAGADVVITGRRTDVLTEAVESVGSPRVSYVTAGIATSAGSRAAAAATIARHGNPDVA